MARRFAKVSEEEIEEAYFFPSDLVNTKTTIPLMVGEERPSGDSCILFPFFSSKGVNSKTIFTIHNLQ